MTRGNYQKLYKSRLIKGIFTEINYFSIRVVNFWNKLLEEVISAKTVKNRLAKHISSRHVAKEALPIIPPPY